MRTKENQGKHDRAVAYWTQHLVEQGWQRVFADLPGKAKPPQIGDFIPDVYGIHGQQEIVIEVETEDSRNLEHSRLQIVTFNSWNNQSQNRRFLLKMA